MSGWNFGTIASAIAGRLVEARALRPVPVAEEFAGRSGEWKGAAVHLATRAWQGETLAVCRVVTLEGHGLEIANLLAVPAVGHGDTIFGADLVSARPDAALVVADLSPIVARSAVDFTASGLPAWAAEVFSQDPLLLRLSVDTRDAATAPLQALVTRFLAADPVSLPSATHLRGVTRYMEAHRSDDRTRTLLSHMFGPEWTDHFVDQVLYPVPDQSGLRETDDAA